MLENSYLDKVLYSLTSAVLHLSMFFLHLRVLDLYTIVNAVVHLDHILHCTQTMGSTLTNHHSLLKRLSVRIKYKCGCLFLISQKTNNFIKVYKNHHFKYYLPVSIQFFLPRNSTHYRII